MEQHIKQAEEQPLPQVVEEAYEQIWSDLAYRIRDYKKIRNSRKTKTVVIQATAVLAFAMGVLIPLVAPLLPRSFIGANQNQGLEWGYISFAIGGLILLVDQIFIISSSYARVSLAEMRLISIKMDLEVDWAAHFSLAPGPNKKDQHTRDAWGILRRSRRAAHSIMQAEVQEWMTEREQARAAFENKVTARSAPQQHG